MLNIGIIGAGIICERHIKAVEASEHAKVVAICDIVKERAELYAKNCGASAFEDYTQIIGNVDLDAVIINLPHSLHIACGEYFAKNKVHVFMEKPLAISKKECEDLISVCNENKVLLQVGHVQAFFVENMLAKEYIQNKKLGELCMINDVRTAFYFDDKRPKWFLNKKLSGGGILMNFGAHSLDKIHYLTNSTTDFFVGKCNFDNNEIEGAAQIFLITENNISANINLCGYNKNNENCTMLYFTNGVLKLETGKGLFILENNEFKLICKTDIQTTFKNQMDSFINAIVNNEQSVVPGEYGLKIIEIIESVYNKQL